MFALFDGFGSFSTSDSDSSDLQGRLGGEFLAESKCCLIYAIDRSKVCRILFPEIRSVERGRRRTFENWKINKTYPSQKP